MGMSEDIRRQLAGRLETWLLEHEGSERQQQIFDSPGFYPMLRELEALFLEQWEQRGPGDEFDDLVDAVDLEGLVQRHDPVWSTSG